jgi:MFS family permease
LKLTPFTAKENKLLFFTSSAHTVSDAGYVIYPSLLFLIALDFNGNYAFLGIGATLLLLSAGISGTISGILSDKVNINLLFAIFSIISATGALLIFASNSKYTLLIGLIIFGTGIGIYHTVGLAAITRNIKNRTQALGIHGMAGLIAISILPTITTTVASWSNWRIPFLFASIVCLSILLLIPSIPKEFIRPNHSTNENQTIKSIFSTLTHKNLSGLYIISMLREFTSTGLMTFTASSIALIGNTNIFSTNIITNTGYLTSIVFLFAAFGSYCGGRLGEKFASEQLLSGLTILLIPVLLLLGTTKGIIFILLMPLSHMLLSSGYPLLQTLVGQYLPDSMHGKGFAIINGLSGIVGATAGSTIGTVIQYWGFKWAFPILSIFSLMVLPIIKFMLFTNKKR